MKTNRLISNVWKNRNKRLILCTLTLLITFSLGRCTSGTPKTEDHAEHSEEASPSVWTCSMHPQIQLPKFGKCPICFMDLIPLQTGSNGGGEREISVSPYAAKLMELETAPVERRFASAEIRMVGRVDYDETRVSTISAWIPGRLDRLFVDYTGVPVRKGDHLAELYSPDLLTAQEELIQAIQTLEKLKNSQSQLLLETAEKTVVASREKLRLWGFTAEQIVGIEERKTPADHMTIYSPAGGIVIHKNAQEGMYVETGSKIYTIADLSKVWVQLDAYESDLNWLRYGGQVDFTTETYPGRTFKGTISFIDPIITPSTRTAKVRVIAENPTLKLMPRMFVRAVARPTLASDGKVMNTELAGKWISPMHPEIIKDSPGTCDICGMPLVTAESLGYVSDSESNAPLLIPTTAAMKTGKRAVVYVELPGKEKPTYEGRNIQLGARLGDFYVVESGLNEGEWVVTRGAFKLDAELQIQAMPSMMNPEGGTNPSTHAHHAQMAEKPVKKLETPDAFSAQLNAVVEAYFEVQQNLAGDSAPNARSAAAIMKEKIEQVDIALLESNAHMVWMEHLKNLNAPLAKLAKEEKIEKQRELFFQLSQQLFNTIKTFPLKRVVYQAYCPMACENKGAAWLQKSVEVLNPYFGGVMLRCGEIQETVGKAKPQTLCPVMGGAINKDVYTDYEGKRIYFCCPGCDTTFKEDPEKYLQQMNDEGIDVESVEHSHAH